jgi:hypothetical protein
MMMMMIMTAMVMTAKESTRTHGTWPLGVPWGACCRQFCLKSSLKYIRRRKRRRKTYIRRRKRRRKTFLLAL